MTGNINTIRHYFSVGRDTWFYKTRLLSSVEQQIGNLVGGHPVVVLSVKNTCIDCCEGEK